MSWFSATQKKWTWFCMRTLEIGSSLPRRMDMHLSSSISRDGAAEGLLLTISRSIPPTVEKALGRSILALAAHKAVPGLIFSFFGSVGNLIENPSMNYWMVGCYFDRA
ncbi:hypothetical protein AG1IA_06001 [Rhizoctonia solani AG-1 IA]|uniref:Uncharacterized protein n=1 Tax=Thanatephorus cucumeris (strain AG1-IA) TaxID=983506 RepID=L8WPP5_THACA|nr:hypothetical protein AG1IA_06001 [Rhizoctonia solani AG-1 IA]